MSTDDEGISDLYHASDTPGPSKRLDDAILDASRKAVEKPTAGGPFSGAWPAAASVAAIIVIAVLLVPVLNQQESLEETERVNAEKTASPELADKDSFDRNSAARSATNLMGSPSPASEPVISEQDMPLSGMARTSGLRKSTAPTEPKLQGEADTDHKTYSRMEAADSAPFAVLTPEMWEIRIAQLIEDGELEQARAEREKLELEFPGYQIGQTLQEKLKP